MVWYMVTVLESQQHNPTQSRPPRDTHPILQSRQANIQISLIQNVWCLKMMFNKFIARQILHSSTACMQSLFLVQLWVKQKKSFTTWETVHL